MHHRRSLRFQPLRLPAEKVTAPGPSDKQAKKKEDGPAAIRTHDLSSNLVTIELHLGEPEKVRTLFYKLPKLIDDPENKTVLGKCIRSEFIWPNEDDQECRVTI